MNTGYSKRIKKSKVRAVICGNKVEVINYEKSFFWNFDPRKREYSRGGNDERRKDSIVRTQIKIRNIIDCNIGIERIKFLTLTYAKNVTDISEAMADWNVFIKKLRYRYGKIEYLTVIEFQKRGAVHFHTVFFNVGYKKNINKVIDELWRHGFIKYKSLGHVKWIGLYVSKYFSKNSFDDRLYGRKGYFCSQGLRKPIVLRNKKNVEKLVERLGDSDIIRNVSLESERYGKIISKIYESN